MTNRKEFIHSATSEVVICNTIFEVKGGKVEYSRKAVENLSKNELRVLYNKTVTPKDVSMLTGCSISDAYNLLEAFPSKKRYCTTRRETTNFFIGLLRVMDIPFLKKWYNERLFLPIEYYNFHLFFEKFEFIAKD